MLPIGKEMAMMDEIRDVAELVREAFERIALQENFSSDLQGLCGRAAVQVWLEADSRGIPLDLVAGEGHAFCRTLDGQIVDVTATQFNYHDGHPPDGYGPVEIGRDHHDGLPWWYEEENCWSSVDEWLSESDDDLYRARQNLKSDRNVVLLAKEDREQAPQGTYQWTEMRESHGS